MTRISYNWIYRNDTKPYGLQFSEWTVLWWKWLLSTPRDMNPALDNSGIWCRNSQNNPNVWFLAGTFGGKAKRNCTIPYGKGILFPVITSEFSFYQDPYLKTEVDLVKAVEKDMDSVNELTVIIDETILTGFNDFRVRSGLFNYTIDGVETQIVSDGYWIFTKPPAIGNHTIFFKGRNIDFFNEVTYYISVVPDIQELI